MGSLADFAAANKKVHAKNPHHETLDNDRYPGIEWTGATEVLEQI